MYSEMGENEIKVYTYNKHENIKKGKSAQRELKGKVQISRPESRFNTMQRVVLYRYGRYCSSQNITSYKSVDISRKAGVIIDKLLTCHHSEDLEFIRYSNTIASGRAAQCCVNAR